MSSSDKNADARGVSHVHAKRLQDGKGDEFRCRLVAMHLAIGERLNVTQSTPTLRVARLLMATASLHVGEHEARDWVVGRILEGPRCLPSRKDGRVVLRSPAARVTTRVLLSSFQSMVWTGEKRTGQRWSR